MSLGVLMVVSACGGGGDGGNGAGEIVLTHEHLGPQPPARTTSKLGQLSDMAQTFVARDTGRLARLELFLSAVGAPDEPAITVELWPTGPTGAPVEDAARRLATATVPVTGIAQDGFVPIDLGATEVRIEAGETYAVVVLRGLLEDEDARWLGHGSTDSPGDLFRRADDLDGGVWALPFPDSGPDLGLRVFVQLDPSGA